MSQTDGDSVPKDDPRIRIGITQGGKLCPQEQPDLYLKALREGDDARRGPQGLLLSVAAIKFRVHEGALKRYRKWKEKGSGMEFVLVPAKGRPPLFGRGRDADNFFSNLKAQIDRKCRDGKSMSSIGRKSDLGDLIRLSAKHQGMVGALQLCASVKRAHIITVPHWFGVSIGLGIT